MDSSLVEDAVRKPLRRKQSRALLGVSVGLLAGASVLGAALLLMQPAKQVRKCPDGTLLTLEGVTNSPPHEFVIGAWWQKLFEGALPPKQRPLHAALPAPIAAGNEPVLWFSQTELPRAVQLRMMPGALYPFLSSVPELLDERGYRMSPGFRAYLNGVPGQERLRFVKLPIFPRRGSAIHVRFYEGQSQRSIGDFVIPNPDPGPHPTWTPEPLPTMRADKLLSVSLTSLQTGISGTKPDQPASPGEPGFARASFQIRENGKLTRDWEPVAVTLSDATGNRVDNVSSRVRRQREDTSLEFDSGLSPAESAWKLRFEFSRTTRAPLVPDEYIDVRNVPVPAPNQKTGTPQTATVQGVRLRFDGVTGRDRYWYRTRVHVTLLTPLGDHRLTVLATDQKGRTFAAYDSMNDGLDPQKRLEYGLYLNIPQDAKLLHFRIGVHRSRYFEFTARPTPAR